MNTSSSRKLVLGASAFVFSTLFGVSAFAGPGPQFWQNVGTAKKAPVVVAAPATTTPVAAHACAGAAVVPVISMKPAWPNGRGPLIAVQTGTKTVCHVCATTTVVTTNDWPSHRGPLVQKAEIMKAGETHVCTTGCAPLSKA